MFCDGLLVITGNADFTNKHSACERKHTSDQYEYDFLTEPLGEKKTITFSVKASNDAHIGFFNNQDADGDPRDVQGVYTISNSDQYEIVICGWGGTQSVIRDESQGDARATTDTTGYITCGHQLSSLRAIYLPCAWSHLTNYVLLSGVTTTVTSGLQRPMA